MISGGTWSARWRQSAGDRVRAMTSLVVPWRRRLAALQWMGCGRTFAEVTLTLADPDRVTTVTVGRSDPDSVDLRNFGICTS